MYATLLGTLMVGALCLTLALVLGKVLWRRGTRKLHGEIDAARLPIQPRTYSEAELAGLPAPVQRYFRTALVDGQGIVAGVAIEQTGTFNPSERAPTWKPFTASQRIVTRRPSYSWDARIVMFPGVVLRVVDAYVSGERLLHASLFGLMSKAKLRGRGELARGELMRFFAETPWYPTALLPSQGIVWQVVDDHSARATLTDGAVAITLLFRFDAGGLIEGVRAESRSRIQGLVTDSMPWQGRFWNHATRGGMRVPLEGEVEWLTPAGAKPYCRVTITGVD